MALGAGQSLCRLILVLSLQFYVNVGGRRSKVVAAFRATQTHGLGLPRTRSTRLWSAVATESDVSKWALSPRYLAVLALEGPPPGHKKKKKKKKSDSPNNNGPISLAYALDRLEVDPNFNKLSTRDRSFARLLLTTVERRLGQIDKVLEYCRKKKTDPKKKTDALRSRQKGDIFVEMVLRLGVAQLVFLHVPAHAAVMETVELLRMTRQPIPESKIKFVNAILRRISREIKQDESDVVESEGILAAAETNPLDNVSPWLREEWTSAWGEEATRRIVASAMEETPRCLTIRRKADDTEEVYQERLKEISGLFDEACILPQGSIRIDSPPQGSIAGWPLYDEGDWWLQDPSATIPAIALRQALVGSESSDSARSLDSIHVVDVCAAPGGKTAQLRNFGFSVTALDRSARRVRRLNENKERLGMDWEVVVADGTSWTPDDTAKKVSGVLLDVPCTATGTGSKRPDVLRRSQDYTDLIDLQHQLACNAADNIVPVGGVLVYATCSLLKQEGEDQVTRMLERDTGAKLETLPFLPGDVPGFDSAIDENGWMRVLPGDPELGEMKQCDGFFVARLKRIK